MGAQLQHIVEYLVRHTKGLAAVDLAKLNLRVGKPLSRNAASIPDHPDTVQLAWARVREILGESGGNGQP